MNEPNQVLKVSPVNRWDSLYIYYISGTGNARASSFWIKEEAEKIGISVVVQQIDRLENISFPGKSGRTIIGFAFPTHGFNAAPIMLKFISGFPRGLCRDVFLLNTRAGMKMSKLFLQGLSGLALILPAFILFLKGYRCRGLLPVDLPSNWIPLHPGIKAEVIDSIFTRCEKIVRGFAIKLFSGKRIFRGLYSLPVDLAISPIGLGYYIAGRFFLSKTFIATGRCNNCGICIKECPTNSILLVRNRPYWKLTCESCMRCLNRCPERAIEAAHGMAVGFYFIIIAVNSWLTLKVIEWAGIERHSALWVILTQASNLALTIAIPAILYLVFHYASSFGPLRVLLRLTSLTSFRFWRRYKPKRTGKTTDR
ncbi:MAG TPA: EFR1 family ferrodoxin [Bacteroidales bacterium]|nr:EFR1 family ferrodoxin [Bacteroidales bacterium]